MIRYYWCVIGIAVGSLSTFFVSQVLQRDATGGAVGVSPTDLQIMEATTDFSFSDGSFLIKYMLEDGNEYWIRIRGPNDPDVEPSVEVAHSLRPPASDSFEQMSKGEIRAFVGQRLESQHQSAISREEAGFLMVLFCYSERVAKIRKWGFGIADIKHGDWFKVFEDPMDNLESAYSSNE